MAEITFNWGLLKEILEQIFQVKLNYQIIIVNCADENSNLGVFPNAKYQNYIDHLVDSFESPIKHFDQVEDAVVVLRKTLAQAEVSSLDSIMTTLIK